MEDKNSGPDLHENERCRIHSGARTLYTTVISGILYGLRAVENDDCLEHRQNLTRAQNS